MSIKIPYALIPAVKIEQRYEHMKSALKRGLPTLQRHPVDPSKTLYLACYGPSLRDTWGDLRGKSPIISMSGSTKWLVERDIMPHYHIDMDPRENKVMTSLPAIKGVTYLVASVCCPKYFDALQEAGVDIILWHTISGSYVEDSTLVASNGGYGHLLVSAGQTIGLGAIQLGGVLGFNRFEIHGMDGSHSMKDGVRHADVHHGRVQDATQTWQVNHIKYPTSKIMANAVAETINTAREFPIITVWYGDGLTQALIREHDLPNACCADQTEKRARLTTLQAEILKMPALESIKGQVQTFWEALVTFLQPTDLPELVNNLLITEPRRKKAKFNTGSIPLEAAVYLRALTRFYQPKVVCEIGTFIGTSTLALHTGRVIYTCDWSNDCVEATESIITFPFSRSTVMFQEIQEPVDLFFFDGRIQDDDLPHIMRLSHPGTIYVFDDYTGFEKGTVNVQKLLPLIKNHILVNPDKGSPSTLSILIPSSPPDMEVLNEHRVLHGVQEGSSPVPTGILVGGGRDAEDAGHRDDAIDG